MARGNRSDLLDRVQNIAIRGMLGALLALPYRSRVRLMGWVATRILAPAIGWRKRIRANLAHACPELDAGEVERLVRAVPDNVGRTLIEIYSGAEFKAHVADTPVLGPGLDAVREARAAGRPVVLVSGHMGNFDVLRARLFAEDLPLGALYREMNNPRFNMHYVRALTEIGAPLFPTDRDGVARFVRHLAGGGMIGILTDVFNARGADVTFFGKSAPTSTAACSWAVKYNALVVPCFGIRRESGLDFELHFEAPVAHRDPAEMTQEINDRLERMVRAHMDQWFWIHRRWKPARKRRPRKATG